MISKLLEEYCCPFRTLEGNYTCQKMGEIDDEPQQKKHKTHVKKKLHLNAFEIFSPGHSNPGQWSNPQDKSSQKDTLEFWENNARFLEKGKFSCYFLGDTLGGFEVYEGSRSPAIKIGTEFPVLDPFLIVPAMSKVTKSLGFGLTATTTFEPPFLLARKFATLDHLTKGRVGWNIVTSWNNSSAKALGYDKIVDHDERYKMADEYLDLVYKLWESSIADDAIVIDKSSTTFADPSKVKVIKHEGKYFKAETPFLVHPSPQRTPFLFQAGTSKAGINFASKHAEGIFVASHSAKILAPKIKQLRSLAEENGRDPSSLKIFPLLTPIVGKDDADAEAKFEEIKKYRSLEGGLIFFSALTGIDLSKYDLDEEINVEDSKVPQVVQSAVDHLFNEKLDVKWTPRKVAEELSIGGNGPVIVGGPQKVADYIEEFVNEADVDGFNITPVVNPTSYEDIIEYLIPELQKRGLYWEDYENPSGTFRSQILGQDHVRSDHPANSYKFK